MIRQIIDLDEVNCGEVMMLRYAGLKAASSIHIKVNTLTWPLLKEDEGRCKPAGIYFFGQAYQRSRPEITLIDCLKDCNNHLKILKYGI